jgi:hypothetical protein
MRVVGVTRETVIPLYGRGNERADPRQTAKYVALLGNQYFNIH